MTYKYISLKDKVIPKFYDFWRSAGSHNGVVFEVHKGGRAGGKSVVIAQRIVYDIIKYPMTALCVRKVGNTLQESCYEQIKEAISDLDLEDKFIFYKNPLKIVYKPRGNSIIFRGADDPLKIKSIKVSKYPIARLWIEECAEFRTEDEVSTIVNSVLRAELPANMFYKIYYSYNPPKMRKSWVNVKFESCMIPANTRVYHSTYLDNPYISKEFIEEAETIKKTRPKKYEWEYMGKPIGEGILPFENLTFREIEDSEIKEFDNIRQGIDWGYATDPFAFVRLHYDKKKRRIYVFDEIYEVKLSNRLASQKIKERGYNDVKINADSAEPKSVDEMWEYGLRVYGARKGAGSVEYGEKWLDDLDAIVIDPVRCPNTAREFESIDYQVDAFGNAKNKLEDANNHTIDSIRYALVDDMRGNIFSFD